WVAHRDDQLGRVGCGGRPGCRGCDEHQARGEERKASDYGDDEFAHSQPPKARVDFAQQTLLGPAARPWSTESASRRTTESALPPEATQRSADNPHRL